MPQTRTASRGVTINLRADQRKRALIDRAAETVLDDWVRKRARPNEPSGASRTYVIIAQGRVVGFYCLASGSVAKQAATGNIRRNRPEPIPVMIIGRLAIDRDLQGRGLGKA